MCCCVNLIIGSYPKQSWITTSLDCVSQQSTIYIAYYFLLHPWHEILVYPSNVDQGHIFQMLELQISAALMDHDTSNPSF